MAKVAVDILKSVKDKMSTLAKRNTHTSDTEAQSVEKSIEVAHLHSPTRPFEEAAAPVAHILPPLQETILSPDFLKSCVTCGLLHKSISSCPRCTYINNNNQEAKPFWRR